MEKTYRFRVSHTTLGEILVEAPDRLTALHRAAKEWGKCWTAIARECIICQLGDTSRKTRTEIVTPVCALVRNDKKLGIGDA